MAYLILSAATEGSRYVACLDAQRRQHGEKFLGLVVPSRGSWAENTKLKPDAIRRGFEEHSVVLWVDADCRVDPPAALPEGTWDVATTQNVHPEHACRVSAGFLLFRDTPRTRMFLARWERLNTRFSKDHPALVKALQERAGGIRRGDMTEWLRGRHEINAFAPDRGVVQG